MRKKLLFLILSVMVLASCGVNRSIKLTDIQKSGLKSGSIAFIGFQYRDPVVSWYVSTGKGKYFRKIHLAQPENVLSSFMLNLTPEVRNKLIYPDYPKEQVFRFNQNIAKDQNQLKYISLSNYIPIYDSLEKEGYMDSYCLEQLNNSMDTDYYLLVVGEAKLSGKPRKNNYSKLSLTPNISVIIYNRMGEKILVRSYQNKYNNIGAVVRKAPTYTKYLIQSIVSNKENINDNLLALLYHTNQ